MDIPVQPLIFSAIERNRHHICMFDAKGKSEAKTILPNGGRHDGDESYGKNIKTHLQQIQVFVWGCFLNLQGGPPFADRYKWSVAKGAPINGRK